MICHYLQNHDEYGKSTDNLQRLNYFVLVSLFSMMILIELEKLIEKSHFITGQGMSIKIIMEISKMGKK